QQDLAVAVPGLLPVEVVHHLAGLDQQRNHALAVLVEGGQVGLEGDGGVVAGVLASVAAAGSRFGGGSGGGTGRSRSVRGGRLGAGNPPGGGRRGWPATRGGGGGWRAWRLRQGRGCHPSAG